MITSSAAVPVSRLLYRGVWRGMVGALKPVGHMKQGQGCVTLYQIGDGTAVG